MIRLLKTNLYVVQIPQDAYNIHKEMVQNQNIYWLSYKVDEEPIKQTLYFDCKFIGTITKEKVFDFDCTSFVEEKFGRGYFNYKIQQYEVIDKEHSFLSLMEASNVYFVNPFGDIKPRYWGNNAVALGEKRFKELATEWHEVEANTLKDGYKWIVLTEI